MKLAFILDPLDSINIKKDSSFAMMREAAARNHALFVIQQPTIALKDNQVIGLANALELTNEIDSAAPWYQTSETKIMPLQAFDAVLMRKDPPFNMEYVYSTYLLELAETQGATIINSPSAIRNFNEKLSIAKFPQFIAPTLVTSQQNLILEFLKEHGDIIVKPLDGMGGTSVFRIHNQDHNTNDILETLTHQGTRTIMAQRFIPDISQGDKRIILIAGEAVPYSLARIPKQGEIRGNLAVGGTGIAQPLSEQDHKIAETIGPVLYEQGLMLVGLDVIGDFLTEINVTSPTGMREITDQTNFNVAGMMVDAIEKHATLF
jgi:glutathione synthase